MLRVLRLTRPLALVGLLLLVGGLFLNAFATGFVCFDTCPSDPSAVRLRLALRILGPGLVTSVSAWILSSFAFIQRRWWIAFGGAFVTPLVLIASGPIIIPRLDLGSLFTFDTASAQTLSLTLWSSLVLGGLMIVLCGLPVNSTHRTRPLPPSE